MSVCFDKTINSIISYHQEVVLFLFIIRCLQNSSESRKKRNEFRNKFLSYPREIFFAFKMVLMSNGMKKTGSNIKPNARVR